MFAIDIALRPNVGMVWIAVLRLAQRSNVVRMWLFGGCTFGASPSLVLLSLCPHKKNSRRETSSPEQNKKQETMSAIRRPEQDDIDKQIALLRVKHKILELDQAEGHGTSMVSLYIPPGQWIRATKMLTEEYGVSTNIKSRV